MTQTRKHANTSEPALSQANVEDGLNERTLHTLWKAVETLHGLLDRRGLFSDLFGSMIHGSYELTHVAESLIY